MIKFIKNHKHPFIRFIISFVFMFTIMIMVYHYIIPVYDVKAVTYNEETCFLWVWDELPETVTRETNYYEGARRWELSEDLALHMCWCYGMRVTHLNTDLHFEGDSFYGHYFWSRPDSNDVVFTDFKNYIAVFDYERRITSTFAREGTRSYRFHNWSAYFFSNGLFSVVDAEGTIYVKENGEFLINPLDDWRFEVTPNYLIDLDQRFIMMLLIHNLPW